MTRKADNVFNTRAAIEILPGFLINYFRYVITDNHTVL